MNEAKRYTVTIFGETYTVVSDESESHIIETAKMVDSSMHEIAHISGSVDTKKIAVFAALRIASMAAHATQQGKDTEKYVKQLCDTVDEHLMTS